MDNPALEYLGLDVMELERKALRAERCQEKRRMRDVSDPFEMDRDTFVGLYRLTPDCTMNIVEELTPYLERQKSHGIAVEHQVLAALRFYAKGCHQDAVGEQYDIGLSQPSISRCIRDVTDVLNRRLLHQHVKFPMTADERYAAKMKFHNARQPFPGTIGAIDCTYVNIIAPREHEEANVNHHGNHALNIQAICDPDLRILNVNARYPGARNDYFIWKNSAVHQALQRSHGEGERNVWLIGDDGYFIEPWLMTPLKHEAVGTPRFAYNEALCKARSVIERCFGVLKAEFRCVASGNMLLYAPDVVSKIFNVCAMLHNMRVEDRLVDIAVDDEEVGRELANHPVVPDRGQDGAPLSQRALGQRVQASIVERYFT